MELVFRKLPPAEELRPQPGEICLVPADPAQRQRRDLASFVLERGPAALLQGQAPPQRFIIDADPKLDDMLAVFFSQRIIEGQPIPPGCPPFARYSAMLREGMRPTNFPLQDSLEGVYLAIRGNAEKALTDPQAARGFLADWARMAEVILGAAEQEIDPFTSPFIVAPSAGSERGNVLKTINRPMSSVAMNIGFLREQAFLAQDMDVYREDIARGEKWEVRLPGSTAKSQGLLLRKPKSLLFKYWTRSECPAPIGGPFAFLAITMREGQWVFTSDPAQKTSLKSLADALQADERKNTPSRADHDPWFDGNPTQRTMVASPRGGTRLSEQTVLRITRRWSRASIVGRSSKRLWAGVALGALAALAVILFFVFQKPAPAPSAATSNIPPPGELADIHDLYVLSVGVSNYKNIGELPSAAPDADATAAAFKQQEGRVWKKVVTKVLKDKDASLSEIIDYGFDSWLLRDQALTSHSLVIVTFAGHGFIHPGTNRYHFAPYDYDRSNPGSTGIFLANLQGYLDRLPCTAVLIFDTCHSGAVNEEDGDPENPDNLLRTIQKSLGDSSHKKGLVVMAACARYQRANETQRWKHGALTLALLEVMGGKSLYEPEGLAKTKLPKPGPSKFVTLKDMDIYITDRIGVLSSEISAPKFRRQAAKTFSAGIGLDQIAIAAYSDK